MDKETIDYIAQRAEILATAGSSKQETKIAAQKWLDTINANPGSEAADAATQELVDFLEGRPTTIDEVIGFAQGPAIQIMGEETASKMLEEQLARKEQGAKWCNCPSCTAAVEVLTKCGRL